MRRCAIWANPRRSKTRSGQKRRPICAFLLLLLRQQRLLARLPAKSTHQTIQVVALPQEIMRCLSSTECWSLRFRRRFVKEEYSAFNEKYCIRPSTHPFIAKETTAVASGGRTGRSSALRLFSLFARRGAALFVNVRRRRRSSLRPSVCPSVRLSVRPSLLRTAIHIHNGHEPRACDLL